MGAFLIVGGALVTAALLVAVLVPMLTCMGCEGTGRRELVEGFPRVPCRPCKESGKVTFYQRYVARIFALEEPAAPGKTPRP